MKKTQRSSSDVLLTQQAERQLYKAIVALRTEEEVKQFMEDLCTPVEHQAFVDRWRVIEFIDEGISYREIAKRTGVSVTTIGRVARSLENGAGGYRLIYERLKQEREVSSEAKQE